MTNTLSQPRVRILLVDTELDFFTKITLLLDEIETRRFALDWATSHIFAVRAMRRQKFDLCLVSSQIGHRRGSDLLRHITVTHPGTPAILLAGTEEMMEAAAGEPMECLDRRRLTVEILRQAIRDSLFNSSSGTVRSAKLREPVALDYNYVTT